MLKAAGGAIAAVAVITAGTLFFHGKVEVLKERVSQLNAMLEERDRQTERVLCLARDMDPGESLSKEDCIYAEVPAEAVPSDCIMTVSGAEGRIIKIPLKQNSYITEGILVENSPQNDERELRYACIRTDTETIPGSCVDVRIRYPDGTDYIVASKKTVYGLDETGLLLHVKEEEILLLDSAIVDAYIYDGTYLYTTAYVIETLQEAAIVNYTPVSAIIDLIAEDPNIVKIATEYISDSERKAIEGRLIADESY